MSSFHPHHQQQQQHQSSPSSSLQQHQAQENQLTSPPSFLSSENDDSALTLLLSLLVLISGFLFLFLICLVFLLFLRKRRYHPSNGALLEASSNQSSSSPASGPSTHFFFFSYANSPFSNSNRRNNNATGGGQLRLRANEGPIDLSMSNHAENLLEGSTLETSWLESRSESVRVGYLRAKMYQLHSRPNSLRTDITLSQFLSIQEKGVSAWAFEPDYDANPSLPILVQSRTEISFLNDGFGMSDAEGGGVSVQSNLPLPKLNEVYYFEAKMYDLPEGSEVAVGLATKPYPSFRLPGWNRLSLGYFSGDGFKCHNYPFTSTSYGPPLKEGDVLGVGYRPRTGTVFFTRNGKKLEDAYTGLGRFNLFPTIGSRGASTVHVNLGQAGFVFIEANVKKWGLAPMAGTLAPPPAYGHQMGSILLASAQERFQPSQANEANTSLMDDGDSEGSGDEDDDDGPTPTMMNISRMTTPAYGDRTPTRNNPSRSIGGNYHLNLNHSSVDLPQSSMESLPHNPPTPRPLDISLERLSNQNLMDRDDGPPSRDEDRSTQRGGEAPVTREEHRPPQYAPIDPYKYAAGVAEVMLSEQFQGTGVSFQSQPLGPSTRAQQQSGGGSSRADGEGRHGFWG